MVKHGKHIPSDSAGQPGQMAELAIIGINQEGQGVARLDGLAVFVPQTIPGDLALVRIEKRLSNYAVGSLVSLVTPSADRITPDCPQSADCGGCSLQMMSYPAQLRQKQQQVFDALQRIGKVPGLDSLMLPIIGMAEPWQYRSKAQFPVAGTAEQPEIGFYANRSHRVIHTPECPVQPPVCDAIRHCVARHIRQNGIEPYQEKSHRGLLRHIVVRIGFFTGQVMVILVLNGEELPNQDRLYENLCETIAAQNDPRLPPLELKSFYINVNTSKTNLILSDDCRLQAGQPWIEEIILGLHYRISPLSFFQVNPRQTGRLYAVALAMADLSNREMVLDLYCGTGSISLLLARQARHVVGIEIIPEAIADARINAEINGTNNATFLVGQAEKLMPELMADGLSADAAVVDPPRKGCDAALLKALTDVQVRRIVYVSCNPA
ncbi:MAG TPA: 23S rRNA (uracil(1939)-C(5))-methyltransferase RlmD, partial [Clostridiales bacterium]|nr:23S rRNA (uracil(1939)-C(5))-methyltransferase RlmD [Clostridiales bacterium]